MDTVIQADAPAGAAGAPPGWRRIGTVIGNTSTGEFTFILRSYQAKLGDIVASRSEDRQVQSFLSGRGGAGAGGTEHRVS